MISGNEIKVMLMNGDLVIKESNSIEGANINMDNIQPCSYDVHLGEGMINLEQLDFTGEIIKQHVRLTEGGYLLKKGRCYLGTTREWFDFKKLAGTLSGCSTNGRKFISIHSTAEHIPSGFRGNITLEIKCEFDTILKVGDRIGQVIFHKVYGDPMLYEGRYQNQNGVTAARTK